MIALALVLIFGSCTSKTPEQKACDAVEKWIKANIDDPKSYEQVRWSVDSVANWTPQYTKAKDSLEALEKSGKLTHDERYKQDSIIYANLEPTFFQGWKVTHEFRAKNAFGAVVKDEATFFVNKEFKVERY